MSEIIRDPAICGGKACLQGHRIRVSDIALAYEHEGLSPDGICSRYPGLSLSAVHSALAYYYDHISEIRDEIRKSELALEEARGSLSSPLAEKLKSRGQLAS